MTDELDALKWLRMIGSFVEIHRHFPQPTPIVQSHCIYVMYFYVLLMFDRCTRPSYAVRKSTFYGKGKCVRSVKGRACLSITLIKSI